MAAMKKAQEIAGYYPLTLQEAHLIADDRLDAEELACGDLDRAIDILAEAANLIRAECERLAPGPRDPDEGGGDPDEDGAEAGEEEDGEGDEGEPGEDDDTLHVAPEFAALAPGQCKRFIADHEPLGAHSPCCGKVVAGTEGLGASYCGEHLARVALAPEERPRKFCLARASGRLAERRSRSAAHHASAG
jgi:hypothetical protein